MSFLKATPPPQPFTPEKYSDTEKLKKFVGTYFADIPGEQKITLSEDGYLVLYGQKLEVTDVEKGIFRFPPAYSPAGTLFNGEPVIFSFDANGNPTGFRLAQVKKFERR